MALNAGQSARVARGGKAVFGARLGILMLEARFPRIPGDMGNASTWPFPVLYKVVRGASPQRVVRERAAGLLPAFLDAAKELVDLGADGITTNCGFLSLYQDEIARHVGVPVATSSLMQAPFIQRTLPPGTARRHPDRQRLNPHPGTFEGRRGRSGYTRCRHRAGREFTRVIIADELEMNVGAAERDILDAGEDLVTRHPEVGAVLLECTNMVPYARALREYLSLPVFDIYSFMSWFHAGLSPRDFGHPGSAPRPWRER